MGASLVVSLVLFILLPLALLFAGSSVYLCIKRRNLQSGKKIVGLFHPYCHAGGGGERVLWVMLKALRTGYPRYQYVIYTGDQAEPETIINKAKETFKIDLTPKDVTFVYLTTRPLVEASRYPLFTLLCQSLGSMVLGAEAIFKFPPHLFIDTMGYSFTYPIAKYLGCCKVGTYTHFPTISVDMLANVSSRREAVNNRPLIASSAFLSRGKLIYYHLFASLYRFMGRRADVVMVNSRWTKNHIISLWGGENVNLLYPPCNTDVFLSLPLDGRAKYQIVSLAQFRPEKDHVKQIHSFARFLDSLQPDEVVKARLILIGSCRDDRDNELVDRLHEIAKSLNIEDKVQFAKNISFNQIMDILRQSNIGIHTMREEHFGIGIVELMAAGLIVIAHNSGGPKIDIIENGRTGYLAESVDEYSQCLNEIVHSEEIKLSNLRQSARKHVTKFNDDKFCSQVTKIFEEIL